MKNLDINRFVFVIIAFFILLVSCGEKVLDPSKPVYVTIKTSMGNITVLLYDDTPLHKENFIKLCQSGEYEGVLFHRVIPNFVVQGGDPASKAHEPCVVYGEGNGGYTVPAEILPHYFNKRGALIDAKESDEVNPDRASAGTQFCIIQGKVWSDEELQQKEAWINQTRRNWLYYKFVDKLKKEEPSLAADSMREELSNRAFIMLEDSLAEYGPVVIPDAHRKVYKELGGAPHLDGSVTIFGEVVEGMEVIDRIARLETDSNDRPFKDVIIKSTRVFQK